MSEDSEGVRALGQGEEKAVGSELQPLSQPRQGGSATFADKGQCGRSSERAMAASPSPADPAVCLLRAGPGKSWVGRCRQEGFLACFAQTEAQNSTLFSSTSALRSLERTGSSSASTLVAETIQLLRTLLGVSPLRYRLSSMWERRLHSLRAGWLRCCSCAQG